MSARDAAIVAYASAAVFWVLCAAFLVLFANPVPLVLAIPALAWIAFYSYTKRFTALCHLVLGSALAFSPIAAALAIDGLGAFIEGARVMSQERGHEVLVVRLSESGGATLALAGMVLLWVAGFDVIYALQDIDFDRGAGLSSIPARLGWRGAIRVSRGMHAGALAMLIMAAASEGRFGPVFYAAVAAVGALLVAEHAVLAKRGKAGLDMAFFTINGVVSCVLGAAGVVDLTLV